MESPAIANDTKCLTRGVYAPAKASDLRSPCPMVNCFANHGYISRDGRNIRRADLASAVREVGVASTLGAMLTYPIYLEYTESPNSSTSASSQTLLVKLGVFLRHPIATTFARFGMRRPGQVDTHGCNILNLDQLGTPGTVEHDISLTRRDHAQGDNLSRQPDLIRDLLASSSDGGKTLTMEDLVSFRKRRIETQTVDNPGRVYEALDHQLACGEIAFVLKVLGDGQKVPCDYVRAVFEDERLPVEEGWQRRENGDGIGWWWKTGIGFLELNACANKVKAMIGVKV